MSEKVTSTSLSESSVQAFTEALKGERGSLDAWLECNDEAEVRAHVEAYASRHAAPQPPAEAHCATCACVPGMTPAIRFDATAAEKEGAVREQLIRMGWTPPAEAQPVELLDEAYGELAADSYRDGPRSLLLTRMEAALAAQQGGSDNDR